MTNSVSKLTFLISLFGTGAAAVACSAAPSDSNGDGDGDSQGAGSTGGDGDFVLGDGDIAPGDGDLMVDDPRRDLPAPPNCADGVLNDDEVCDDGNEDNGDGCYGNCLGIDPGWICPEAGQACFEFAVCGDGLSKFPEQCDDGNKVAGDGCSDNCKVEIGFKCPDDGMPCSPTTCGDGMVEGAEMCEPSLTDGCTAQCQFAPNCSGGACTSSCGDGLVLSELCDDGNTLSGDGCSSTCEPEMGYTCTNESTSGECEKSPDTGECILRIPVIYRDFSTSHSDFESFCGGTVATTDLVETMLSGGKPVATAKAAATNAGMCISNFSQWYTDGAHATTYPSEIVLYDDGAGNFVNRFGPNGEKWATTTGVTCGGCSTGMYDGSPFFFPVDNIPDAKADGGTAAQVSTSEYGMDGSLVNDPSGVLHNFAFTSEVAYWFAFEETTNASLNFIGDDDVWVFVNGQLAVDLGGLHQAIPGTVTINSTTAPALGMTPGNVYEIKVFHAERHTTGSTFKLTLSGFDTSRSDCRATCGDGIVAFGEQCDAGDKNGEGYNQCGVDCQLGSFCGDGVKDEGEQCDDNAPNADPNCSNCRIIVVR